MSQDTLSAAAELEALLAKALGSDPGGNFPEDPNDLQVEQLFSWRDIAAILVAYPDGLPAAKKNGLLERCRMLTREDRPNPDLTVQVARMPVLGRHTTRMAKQLIQAGQRKRTGLTRQGGAISTGRSRNALANRQRGPQRPAMPSSAAGSQAAAAPPPSPKKLRQLEQQARLQEARLGQTPDNHPTYASLRRQTQRAWQALADALAERTDYLEAQGAEATALDAYRNAHAQVAQMVAALDEE